MKVKIIKNPENHWYKVGEIREVTNNPYNADLWMVVNGSDQGGLNILKEDCILIDPPTPQPERLSDIYAEPTDPATCAAEAIIKGYKNCTLTMDCLTNVRALIVNAYAEPSGPTLRPLAKGDVLERTEGIFKGNKYLVAFVTDGIILVNLSGNGRWGAPFRVTDDTNISKAEAEKIVSIYGLSGWVRLPKGTTTL